MQTARMAVNHIVVRDKLRAGEALQEEREQMKIYSCIGGLRGTGVAGVGLSMCLLQCHPSAKLLRGLLSLTKII